MHYSILINNQIIKYQIKAKQRKTISLIVLPGGDLEISAPKNCSKAFIEQIILKKSKWILSKIEKQKLKIISEKGHIERGEIHYLGKAYPIKLSLNIQINIFIENEIFHINTHYITKDIFNENIIQNWLLTQAQKLFQERINYCIELFPESHKVKPIKLIIKELKRTWGSMSSIGIMTLNIRLIHRSLEEIDYVIIHELCHRIHMNHSKEFWALVKQILPSYKEIKTKLG